MGDHGLGVRDEIVAAAMRQVGDVDLAALFRAVTPETLAADERWSASSVRYHFGAREEGDGRGRLSFQRRDLALAVLAAALGDAVGASSDAADAYETVAATLRTAETLDEVLAAMAQNLAAFVPGATTADVSPRERMYFLALAVCDDDRAVARELREARTRQIERYLPMYQAFIDALDRELRPGRTLQDLANAIYALLDGHIARLRFDPSTPSDWLGDTVTSVFASFTVRRGAEPQDVARDLLNR